MVSFSPSRYDHPTVLCPRCQRPMMRGAALPIMFTSGLSNVAFNCETCNTETVRTVNGDGSPHIAGMAASKG